MNDMNDNDDNHSNDDVNHSINASRIVMSGGSTITYSRQEHDKPCIVLAESSESDRRILTQTFRESGREVIVARTGRQLIDAVYDVSFKLERTIDLLVVDEELPVMSGLVALEVLRDQGFHIPTVLVTARSDARVTLRAPRYGASVLRKPVHPVSVREAVLAALSLHRSFSSSSEA